MDMYHKPYGQELLGGCAERRFPYSDDFFRSRPIFPLIVFDGGAYFLIKELLGGRDPYSRDLFCGIQSGELFKHWTARGQFDWDMHYRATQSSCLPLSAERHIWLNRLYFLLPLAQEYLLTREETWAERWMKWLEDWIARHPYQKPDGRAISGTDYVWRDMQVTWRQLVLLYSVKMLAGSRALGKPQWQTIYACMEQHAAHLHKEGLGHIADRKAHNHILQIGLALLLTGVLFPEMADSASWYEAGRRIIEINMEKAILPDGGSVEGCPSYSHFIARMYLECLLLLEKNGLPAIGGLRESVARQYQWLAHMMSPTGHTLQIGDSYALDAARDLEIVQSLMPVELPTRDGGVLLPDSKCCALHAHGFDIYADAMDRTQGHQHRGIAHIVAYYGGKPLIADTGCAVYDRKDFREFYMSARAHNTLVIRDASTREELTGRPDVRAQVWLGEPDSHSAVFETVAGGCTWRRTVKAEAGTLLIEDQVNAKDAVVASAHLHFVPTKARMLSEFEAAVSQEGLRDARVDFSGDVRRVEMDVSPAMDADNGFFYTTAFRAEAEGKAVKLITRVRMA